MGKKKFKDLTPEEIEYLTHIYYEEDMSHREKMEILTKKFGGVSERSIRRWWKEELDLSEVYSKLPKQLREAQMRNLPKGVDVILYSAVQNKTGINNNMLKNMEAYKDFLEKEKDKTVEIVLSPTTYRNPTSPAESNKGENWWDDRAVPYLYYNKIEFGDVLLSTDSRIRPTTKNPLTSYEVLAKDRHLILPHPIIHFKTLPRFRGKPLRTMSSTGYLSRKNFSFSKSGETAQENFSYGFSIIEKKDNGTCYIPRNVKVTQDGNFIDLIYQVEDGTVSIVEDSQGFVWGDIHAANINMEIFNETLRLYNLFKPKQTVLHDVVDFSTINPHERKDVFIQRRKIIEGKNIIEDEINHSFDIIRQIQGTNTKVNVVISNHCVFLDRHINDMDWKRDLYNSPTFLKYAHIYQTVDITKYGSIYGYLLKEEFGEDVSYINFNESLDICGYETGSHTDHGANGARASIKTFSKLNTKLIGGHRHAPFIEKGFTGVGVTCSIEQYYTRKGLSSWAYAHSVIHNNCKNQLLVFTDDYKLSSLI